MADDQAKTAPKKKTQIVVEEGGLEFVTPGGRVLGCLTDTPAGPRLALFDLLGQVAVIAGADEEGGFVTARSSHNNGAAHFASGDRGGQVGVANTEGGLVARLMPIGGGGSVQIADNALHAKAHMSVLDGCGVIAANNEAGQTVASLGASQGDGGLLIHDKDGAMVFSVPVWKYTAGGEKPGADPAGAESPSPAGGA